MTLWKHIAALMSYDRDTVEQAAVVNMDRLLLLTVLGIPTSLGHVIWFTFWVKAGTREQLLWRYSIIASHTIMVAVMAITLVLCLRWKARGGYSPGMSALSNAFFVFTLFAGHAIVSMDQLVTTNVTPFMIACFIAGSLLRVRPQIAAATFTAVLCPYLRGIAVYATDPRTVASNRVNGITMLVIAAALNLALWQNHRTRVMHERQIEAQQRQLEALAYQDPLTGIFNRRFLEQLIEKEISLMRRFGHESSLVLIDIDGFKRVNDTYGHPAGDCILGQVAKVLAENVRQCDTLARLGGEEFAVLLPHTSLAQAAEAAERLRDAVHKSVFLMGDTRVEITISAGVSCLCEGDYHGRSDYYARADAALYEAKKAGKNRVVRLSTHDM